VRAWATSLTEAPPEVAAGGECDPRREADKCVEFESIDLMHRPPSKLLAHDRMPRHTQVWGPRSSSSPDRVAAGRAGALRSVIYRSHNNNPFTVSSRSVH